MSKASPERSQGRAGSRKKAGPEEQGVAPAARSRAAGARAAGAQAQPEHRVMGLYVRAVGFVAIVAFASLAPQLGGLVGPEGILPAQALLDRVAEGLGAERFWRVPTLAWWTGASTFALQALCVAGAFGGLLALLDRFSRVGLVLAWTCALSLVTVGQDFTSFQWDVLLLEALFVALAVRDGRGVPSPAGVWLARGLLAKVLLLSAAVKLSSGDEAWRGLTALRYHFWTQPLPNPLSRAAASLPHPVLDAATLATLVLEAALPLLILAGRRGRLVTALGTWGLMGAIALTGNYGWFNLLTAALALCCLEDRHLRLGPPRLPDGLLRTRPDPVAFGVVALWLPLSLLQVAQRTNVLEALPERVAEPCRDALRAAAPFRTVNAYGLFAVMTTARPELSVEGTQDGVTWHPYVFRYKPGALTRVPPQVAPHMPRLDWQMWFAALGPPGRSPWLAPFLVALLEDREPVVRLLAHDPFPDGPPTQVRVVLHHYHFADADTRRTTGQVWVRGAAEPFVDPIGLR